MPKKYAIQFPLMHGEFFYYRDFFVDGPDVGSKIKEYSSFEEAQEAAFNVRKDNNFKIVEYPETEK